MSGAPLPVRLSTRLAFRAWFTPPPTRKPRDAELAAIPTAAGDVPAIQKGSGPLALVLHGWGADPTRLSDLADHLAGEGYRAVVPYLPGAAGTAPANILDVVQVVHGVTARIGSPELVVAHSFGAMVARVAFQDGGPPQVVYLAPLVKVGDAIDTFAGRLRLAPWVRKGIHRRLEAWNPPLWPLVNTLRADQVPGAEMLILHDPQDHDTSFERAAALAAIRPETTIVATRGTGHRRILSDPATFESITEFLTDRAQMAG